MTAYNCRTCSNLRYPKIMTDTILNGIREITTWSAKMLNAKYDVLFRYRALFMVELSMNEINPFPGGLILLPTLTGGRGGKCPPPSKYGAELSRLYEHALKVLGHNLHFCGLQG